MPNQKEVQQFIQSNLRGVRFVVVSNREPYVHSYSSAGDIQCSRPASGMVTALDPVLQASGASTPV